MEKQKLTIVGGNFGEVGNPSSVINKIIPEMINDFSISYVVNGGTLDQLPNGLNEADLTLWMPNIDNENDKQYPKKKIGSVLICSKVMREGYKEADAVSRIFKMGGNAVIAIYVSEESGKRTFTFQLIDALGNTWYKGDCISTLCVNIIKFHIFTKYSHRARSVKYDNVMKPVNKAEDCQGLLDINNSLANRIQLSCGVRFFGNISTRCQKLFPSTRVETAMLVSPRNTDKSELTPDQMVVTFFKELPDSTVYYVGDRKPSVDTPSQLMIYEGCKEINFMIHGHAFIKDAPTTETYYLCGDTRENREVLKIIGQSDVRHGAINLKNHGFLIYADTLENLKKVADESEFFYERTSL